MCRDKTVKLHMFKGFFIGKYRLYSLFDFGIFSVLMCVHLSIKQLPFFWLDLILFYSGKGLSVSES